MSQAHYHLILNHLPIIFPIAGLLVLVGGFTIKSEIVKRTSYFIFIFGSLTTIAAMATGEDAEEALKCTVGMTEGIMNKHEEMAEQFALLAYILGSSAVVAVWVSLKKKSYTNYVAIALILYSCVVLYFGQQTGTSGGEIRHSEIRSANTVNE